MSKSGSATQSTIDAARDYVRRGWAPVPIPRGSKQPLRKGWPQLRFDEAEIARAFEEDGNVGLILGEASGWLVDVDLDCEEARELAEQYLPPTDAISGRPSAPDSHRWYIAAGATTFKHQDPVDRSMIVELRSTGTQTVVGPSVHPNGERYTVLDREPASVPAPMLTACVAALADAVIKQRHGTIDPAAASGNGRNDAGARIGSHPGRVGHSHDSSSDVERRALAYLNEMPAAVSGQGGHNVTYTAAVALVHGFGIGTDRALAMLWDHFNPRCEPPWSEKELAHKVEDAATKSHDRPFGWLRDASKNQSPERSDDVKVDISAIVESAQGESCDRNPGILPVELLRVPGFVSEVMDHCLQSAPYPSPVLAFCGALALQALLAGRKVRDQADNRTNIYLLSLAHSSAGKDWPRKINTKVMHHIGLANPSWASASRLVKAFRMDCFSPHRRCIRRTRSTACCSRSIVPRMRDMNP